MIIAFDSLTDIKLASASKALGALGALWILAFQIKLSMILKVELPLAKSPRRLSLKKNYFVKQFSL